MAISATESILIIAVCALCTIFERALPFLFFRGKEVPDVIQYLGGILPMAIMATLVIYCLKETSFTSAAGFLPQLIACSVTVVLHLWRRNAMLSIFGGTVIYMFLIQAIF